MDSRSTGADLGFGPVQSRRNDLSVSSAPVVRSILCVRSGHSETHAGTEHVTSSSSSSSSSMLPSSRAFLSLVPDAHAT
eukprot:2538299-Rhodomonas_salina.5